MSHEQLKMVRYAESSESEWTTQFIYPYVIDGEHIAERAHGGVDSREKSHNERTKRCNKEERNNRHRG